MENRKSPAKLDFFDSLNRPGGSPGGFQRLQIPEDGHSGEMPPVPQLLLDAQQAIVFCHPLTAAGSAAFDLTGVYGHCQVGDGGVLRLTRPVGDDGVVAGALGQVDGL